MVCFHRKNMALRFDMQIVTSDLSNILQACIIYGGGAAVFSLQSSDVRYQISDIRGQGCATVNDAHGVCYLHYPFFVRVWNGVGASGPQSCHKIPLIYHQMAL